MLRIMLDYEIEKDKPSSKKTRWRKRVIQRMEWTNERKIDLMWKIKRRKETNWNIYDIPKHN